MNKFLIIDSRLAFFQDLSSRIDIEDDRELEAEVILFTNNEDVHRKLMQNNIDAIVISDAIAESPDFNIPQDVRIIGYLERKDSTGEIFQEKNIYNAGFFKRSNEMLDFLENFNLNSVPSAENNSKHDTPSAENVQPVRSVPVQELSNNVSAPYIDTMSFSDNKKSESTVGTFCSNCGTQVKSDSKFCPSCGNRITRNESETNVTEMLRNVTIDRDEDPKQIDKMVYEDIQPKKHKCKIISVYAAKGGVGKTTLATSIAVYLAMTSTDRRNTRVCIVDYNIDFGDVRPTLGFSQKGVDMMSWAGDIDEKLSNGMPAERIQYSKEEIENNFLQKKVFNKMVYGHNVELYGLIAPVSHEDSMDISEDSLPIMLSNLRDNGDFDYIICDTGNNTRDSSFTALDMADNVFLVNTQDVTTVSCNDSFLRTMQSLDFDTSKISLIINNIVPAKETGVSVKDIEETVPFPCIARIRHNTGVILANNKGVPIVFDAGTQFTKEISNIISVVTDENLIVQTKKKGLFSFLKK